MGSRSLDSPALKLLLQRHELFGSKSLGCKLLGYCALTLARAHGLLHVFHYLIILHLSA